MITFSVIVLVEKVTTTSYNIVGRELFVLQKRMCIFWIASIAHSYKEQSVAHKKKDTY